MKMLRRGFWVVVFVGLMVFGWQFAHGNAEHVSVHLPMGDLPPVALWQVLVVTFLLGTIVTGVLMGLGLLRSKLEGRRFKKVIRELEAEVHQLRHLPAPQDDERPRALDALEHAGEGAA